MTLFWLIAAGLVLLAVVLFLPALLRGGRVDVDSQQARNIAIARERLRELDAERERGELDPESYQQARRELQLTLASELGEEDASLQRSGRAALLVSLLILIPAVSVGVYQFLGSPQHLGVVGPGGSAATGNPHAGTQGTPSLEEMVGQLAERLAQQPDNPDGWYMLARSYLSLGRFEDAIAALERLRGQVGDHPTVLVMLADATAMTQGGRVSGRPAELVRQALDQAPDDTTALWLAGKAAEEQGDYAGAVAYWRRAEPALAEEPELQAELRGLIDAAEARGGVAPAAAAPAPAPSIDVTVELDPALAAQAAPDDRIFVFARAVEGPPMPLAAARLQVRDLPVQVTLDDSMAMMPQLKLSTVSQVKVSARVSRSGQPTAQSGDLQSEVRVVDVGPGVKVALRIDQKVP